MGTAYPHRRVRRATVARVAGDYRSVIIGASGGRARHHALAYRHQRRARLVAVSARTAAPRDELADAYGIAARYDDYREMLARERPDVVHVNTPPNARLELLEQIAAAGVPAAIIEKPVAIDGPDCAALAAFARTSPLKVAVNHQLHYHAARRRLQRLVADGAIGAVRFIDASTGMNAAYQGTHALQAVFAFAGGAPPAAVFGQASGSGGLQPSPRNHFAPDDLLAAIDFAGGLRAVLRCGGGAPRLAEAPDAAREAVWAHKRIAVYGERGHAIWTMWGWETLCDGRLQRGTHDYWQQDAPGESALVDSVLDWIEGARSLRDTEDNGNRHTGIRCQPTLADQGAAPHHPLALARATDQYAVLLAAYRSAIAHRPLAVPGADQSPVIDALRAALGAAQQVAATAATA